jgi:hypothetical protein
MAGPHGKQVANAPRRAALLLEFGGGVAGNVEAPRSVDVRLTLAW